MSLIILICIFSLSNFTFGFKSDCGAKYPEAPSDCVNRQGENATNYCCMLSRNDTASFCKWINRTDYLNNKTTYTLNNTSFDMGCELNPEPQSFGTICGPDNPENKTVCYDAAPRNAKSACCLYQNNNTRFCFWMEFEYLSPFYTYDENSVQCTSLIMNLGKVLTGVLALLLLF